MGVPVMQVGVVRVLVAQRRVAMPMRMRLARWIVRRMRVSMVDVVAVPVLVLVGRMAVLVLVALGQMQP
jgi:hypothetical protein